MAETLSFTIGQVARLQFTTADDHGVLHDPATLTVTQMSPNGTLLVKSWPADQEIVRVADGSFYFDVPIAEYGPRGAYLFRCTATSGDVDVTDALEGSIPVRKPTF